MLADWRSAKTRLADVDARMVEVLDELELTERVTSIPGLSAVGAAAILAETGDPPRFDSPRALVKHAGLCPTRQRQRHVSRPIADLSSRPARAAAGRLARGLGALAHNPVMADRYRYLTTRQHNRLTDGQARAAIAAALLRWIHVIVTRYNPPKTPSRRPVSTVRTWSVGRLLGVDRAPAGW